jgi:uncharacterized membrane protein
MDPAEIAKFLESGMLVAFGCAWPANILHTLRHKSTQGKSLVFLMIVLVGYLFGIAAKILGDSINFVLLFYVLNLAMVTCDILLYLYYWNKERERYVAGG